MRSEVLAPAAPSPLLHAVYRKIEFRLRHKENRRDQHAVLLCPLKQVALRNKNALIRTVLYEYRIYGAPFVHFGYFQFALLNCAVNRNIIQRVALL